MHNPIDSEELERVKQKPIEYMNVALNDKQNGGRDSALVLTKEDILKIKRYEKRGRNIPTTPERLEKVMGQFPTDIPGLTASDIVVLFQDINSHALFWSAIEELIKSTSTDIDLFSAQFVTSGNQLIAALDKMEIARQFKKTVGQLTQDDIRYMDNGALSSVDTLIKNGLSEYLTDIAADIEKRQELASRLAAQLKNFAETMSDTLLPSVNDKITIAKRSGMADHVKNLEDDIEELAREIDEKNREYRTHVKNTLVGLFGGPIGVAITGGIFGSKAEKARKAKNKLIATKAEKIAELGKQSRMLNEIHDIGMFFRDLSICMDDAEQAASNLSDLWSMIFKYITHSARELAEITDAQTLFMFALSFKSVVQPWEEIKGINNQLLHLFNDALTLFKNEQ